MNMRQQIIVLGLLTTSAFAWCFSLAGEARQEVPKQDPVNGAGLKAESFYNSTSCVSCHNRPQPYVDAVVNPIICRCDEFGKWATSDKHRLAFAALKGERAKKMGELLNINVQDHKACVACHSVWIEVANLKKQNAALIEEGVSCFVCHGPDKEQWVDLHGSNNPARRERWRGYTREKKQDFFGMFDLWDPAKRTKLCVSCHIGNVKEGKVLTHDMYAAGHPPLPSFDMANFSEAMRHWQNLGEKDPGVIKTFNYRQADVDAEQIGHVTIGSLVSFQETLQLLASQAQDKASWPDFAQFDCYACHHDLKKSSWRQMRGYSGKPGRPQMQTWPTVLVELALYHSSGGDDTRAGANSATLHQKLKALHEAFNQKPFGSPDLVASTAQDLANWVDNRTKELLAANTMDPSAHQRLLDRLAVIQKNNYLDHESARQVAGAFRAIYVDGWKKKKEGLSPEVMNLLKSLDDQLSLTGASAVRKKFFDMRLPLTTQLLNPQKAADVLAKNLRPLHQIYEQEVQAYLEGINAYEPERFKTNIAELAKKIPKD